MPQCKVNENKKYCPCTYEPCEKKGMCCECIRYHRQRGELPACYFPPDIEATYDRSIEKFIEIYQKRGRWW
jgi:hypothetical protein